MRVVVLDTNVLISAIFFGGKPGTLVRLAIEGELVAATSAALISELEGVLLSKFRLPPSRVELIVAEWKALSLFTEPSLEFSLILEDPSDNRLLECAVSAKADAIVSGDRHLLSLKTFRGIPIFTPHDFLAQWRKERC